MDIIVRVKICGRYRKCQLLSTRGKVASLRLLSSNPGVDYLKEYWDMSLSFIHPDDRHFCADPNFEEGSYAVTFLRDIFFKTTEEKTLVIRKDKVMHLRGLLRENGRLIIFTEKYGEISFPLEAVAIV